MVLLAEISIKKSKFIFDLILQLADKYNTRIFLVGGPVRDLIMSKRKLPAVKQDLDIAVENDHEKIGEDLAKELHARIIRYPQFMTMTLQLKNGSHIDIARTRKEFYTRPAILPIVYPASIKEDLKRRDFTINAMAMEIAKKTPYPVIDPHNGKRDLQDGLVRILHPQSFIDDPTRIFRAIRFATRFGFKIDAETITFMKKAIRSNLLKLLSGERILYELKNIFEEEKSTEILKVLQKYGVIKNIYGVKLQPKFFSENRIFSADKKIAHFFSYIPEICWVKYPFTKESIKVAKTLKNFSRYRKKLARAKKPSEIYKVLIPLPILALEILSILEQQSFKNKIRRHLVKYSKVKIFTSGKTLKEFKIPSGEMYSKVLKEVLYAKLDGRIKTKKQEVNYIKKLLNV